MLTRFCPILKKDNFTMSMDKRAYKMEGLQNLVLAISLTSLEEEVEERLVPKKAK